MSETAEAPFRVALTFDAEHPDRSWCPPDAAPRILDVLRSHDVRATVFVQGRWARSQPATARRIADDGHLVGHHSHYHARLPLMTDPGIESDLHEALRAIESMTGTDPRPWYRCPFGAGHDDARILGAIERAGFRNVHWNVEVEDWEAHRTGAAIAADTIRLARERGDGAVVLLHTWPGGTADAVEQVIVGLRDAGATFVTVDELEELP